MEACRASVRGQSTVVGCARRRFAAALWSERELTSCSVLFCPFPSLSPSLPRVPPTLPPSWHCNGGFRCRLCKQISSGCIDDAARCAADSSREYFFFSFFALFFCTNLARWLRASLWSYRVFLGLCFLFYFLPFPARVTRRRRASRCVYIWRPAAGCATGVGEGVDRKGRVTLPF